MLQFITAGESHGKYLTAIIEGLPSGLVIDEAVINHQLKRRQSGYGRGARQKIENDTIIITAGVFKGKTTGAPVGLMIKNDEVNLAHLPQLTRPRPGHADLVGAIKYNQGIREILERSSARETAMRVAVGAVCRQLLKEMGIDLLAHVVRVGPVTIPPKQLAYKDVKKAIGSSNLLCAYPGTERRMKKVIQAAEKAEDTMGGEVQVLVSGMPIGIGSHVHYERKLDARLTSALMSVQAIKAVQVGAGVQVGILPGSKVHDEILYSKAKGYYRNTNNAGGIEGGMSNGEIISLTATLKPIATLKKPLKSVDMNSKRSCAASFERSDTCAISACATICENAVSFELAKTCLEKFGGDSMRELRKNVSQYQTYCKQR